jgi:hypothetical protein
VLFREAADRLGRRLCGGPGDFIFAVLACCGDSRNRDGKPAWCRIDAPSLGIAKLQLELHQIVEKPIHEGFRQHSQ